MTIAERITQYLTERSDVWIRPTCLADVVKAKPASVSSALCALLEDGVVQKRQARFSQGVEYAIAKGEGA